MAVTRSVPDSFCDAITKYSSSTDNIDLQRAKDQHAQYVEQLSTLIPHVQVFQPLHHLPDSVFVEDTVVTINDRAVITHPGHESRRAETTEFDRSLRDYLQTTQYNLEIEHMQNENGHDDNECSAATNSTHFDNNRDITPFCDGGDVLFTGRHLFVGLSSRTNMVAVDILRTVFEFRQNDSSNDNNRISYNSIIGGDQDDLIVIPVQSTGFVEDALHLKSVVTAVDTNTLLVPMGGVGDQVLKDMDAYHLGYDVVRLPSMLACNVVSANGGLLAQDDGCTISRSIIERLAIDKGYDLRWLDFSEYAKCDGALTCCSVLFNV